MGTLSAPLVASIGTSHPWNIAGVGLDARVAAEFGVAHAMVLAAVSAQDEQGVRGVYPVEPQALKAQLESLPSVVAAFRIGALVNAGNVRLVAEFLRSRASNAAVVVDPVLSATLGGELRSGAGLEDALRAELLALPVIVTPNVDETEALLGSRPQNAGDLAACGERFVRLGARAALMKGGHLSGEAVDVIVTARDRIVMSGERYAGSMRGSGCTLAAALACELAQGKNLVAAAAAARDYVREKIAAGTVRNGLQVAF
jgi:hydroxymethylpyrimidine/phosphomethylpyrimidine kinase